MKEYFYNASNNKNNSKSLHPTSAHNYDSMTSTLSPNSSPINPPPTFLYPDKLPKYIEQKDDIVTKKPTEKNKHKNKTKNKIGKNKNKNKKINKKNNNKNDEKNVKEKNVKKKKSNKDITREKFMKKRVKTYSKKNRTKQPKENNSN